MDELDQLYQEVILDHNRNPRNFGELPEATHSSVGHNPLCGDHIEIFLNVVDDVIQDIKFQGVGCAISKASASIMTTVLKGKTIEEAKQLFERFHRVVTSQPDEQINIDGLGKLSVFAGVREFPARVKCASLAWHTMVAAIENEKQVIPME